MPKTITPEMITIAIASLAALAFLLTLITIVSLSRIRKRLLALEAKSLELEEKDELLNAADKITLFDSHLNMSRKIVSENQKQLKGHETKLNEHAAMFGKISQIMNQQAANLTQASEKTMFVESCLDGLNKKITESKYQLTAHESKLNEHDNLLGENSQRTGKNADDLTHAFERIEGLDNNYQDIKVFRGAVEKTCSIISNAFGSIQATTLQDDSLTAERQNLHEEARISS